jgi:hypothetical protein
MKDKKKFIYRQIDDAISVIVHEKINDSIMVDNLDQATRILSGNPQFDVGISVVCDAVLYLNRFDLFERVINAYKSIRSTKSFSAFLSASNFIWLLSSDKKHILTLLFPEFYNKTSLNVSISAIVRNEYYQSTIPKLLDLLEVLPNTEEHIDHLMHNLTSFKLASEARDVVREIKKRFPNEFRNFLHNERRKI